MKILFFRHGESTENAKGKLATVVNDAPLTKKGLKQTHSFIHNFKKYNVEKVYYSPKERAKKVSEIMDKKLKIPHKLVPTLSERDWGKWGNEPWKKVSKKLDKLTVKKRYEIIPPNGESWKQFEKRLLKALKEIELDAMKRNYKTIAIITHRGNLRAIFPVLLKTGIKKHKDFSTETGSLSILSKGDKNSYSLEILNFIPKKWFEKIFKNIEKNRKED